MKNLSAEDSRLPVGKDALERNMEWYERIAHKHGFKVYDWPKTFEGENSFWLLHEERQIGIYAPADLRVSVPKIDVEFLMGNESDLALANIRELLTINDHLVSKGYIVSDWAIGEHAGVSPRIPLNTEAIRFEYQPPIKTRGKKNIERILADCNF